MRQPRRRIDLIPDVELAGPSTGAGACVALSPKPGSDRPTRAVGITASLAVGRAVHAVEGWAAIRAHEQVGVTIHPRSQAKRDLLVRIRRRAEAGSEQAGCKLHIAPRDLRLARCQPQNIRGRQKLAGLLDDDPPCKQLALDHALAAHEVGRTEREGDAQEGQGKLQRFDPKRLTRGWRFGKTGRARGLEARGHAGLQRKIISMQFGRS